jgi:hypothetical protein
MTIHLKDPNYLSNKNYYEKYFHNLKIESGSIKNLIKLYSTKIDTKKKKLKTTFKKIKEKRQDNLEINIVNDDSKNLKEHGIEIEIKHKEKDNQNLFKIENHDKNKKIDNDKANEIKDFTEKRVINNSLDRINNSQMNFGKLSDNNNIINNNLKYINDNNIDILNIINSQSFNINNKFEFPIYNYFNNNILFNTKNLIDLHSINNNNLVRNNLTNNIYNYYNNNLNQLNFGIFAQNLLNIPTNTLINENNILKAKIDLLNSISNNIGQNVSNIYPNIIKK